MEAIELRDITKGMLIAEVDMLSDSIVEMLAISDAYREGGYWKLDVVSTEKADCIRTLLHKRNFAMYGPKLMKIRK